MLQSELYCGKLTCPLGQLDRRCQGSQRACDSWRIEVRIWPEGEAERGQRFCLTDFSKAQILQGPHPNVEFHRRKGRRSDHLILHSSSRFIKCFQFHHT